MTVAEALAMHEAQLVALTNRDTQAVLAALADSENEVLLALVSEPDLLVRARLGFLAARLATWRGTLEGRLRGVFDAADRRVLDLVGDHLAGLAAAGGPEALTEVGRLQAIATLGRQHNLLLHQYSVNRFSHAAMGRIQAALVAGVAQGDTPAGIARRLRGAAGPRGPNRREAELVARMELARAYSQGAGEVAATLYEIDSGWRKRIVEVFDARNHPFSRAANGAMAKPGERFKVDAAEVADHAQAMGRAVGRVLWEQRAGYYRGMSLPAHFGERGRVVPWHVSWAAP